MSDEPINCTRVKCSNCDNVVFIMTDENSTQEFIDWVHKEKTNIACFKCLKDHVSKSELRKWCEGVIQKEVIEGRKSLRRSSDEDIEEIGHLDGMKEVLYRILNRFCKGEKS